MDVFCPHCNQRLTIVPSKPGRFAPACPNCHRKVLITVSANPSEGLKIEPLPADLAAAPKVTPAAGPAAATPAAATPATPAPGPQAATTPEPAKQIVKPDLDHPHESEATQEISASQSAAASIPAAAPPAVAPAPAVTPPAAAASAAATQPDQRDQTEATGAWAPSAAQAPEASESPEEQTAPTVPAEAMPAAAAASAEIPETLGGYRVLKRLGQGAMGAVYLAKQLSLNRSVALKTIRPEVAKSPVSVARFMREAYAAAQLVHHNVIQIYDLAAERGVNFFSMEFVNGQNLADLVRARGKLPPQEAAGLMLQAARGLRFAHQNGMVHRDVKPANLMLNDQGVVKVADLGLVKVLAEPSEPVGDASETIPVANPQESGSLSGEVTLARTTMGTAAYIAPEQITDARNVDNRADIYSLGCTFFVLLTGRPPFEGKNAFEVMKRHQSEPVPRPDNLDPDVPSELGEIIAKMTAKKPGERYQTLDDAIADLEAFLARGDEGTLKPRAEHLRDLKNGLEAFNDASWRKLRRLAVLGLFALGGLVFLYALLTGSWGLASGMIVYGLVTFTTYVITRGASENDHFFTRVRAAVLGGSFADWLLWSVGILAVLVLIVALKLLGVVLVWGFLGAGTAMGLYFGIDRMLTAERAPALDFVRKMIADLRVRGLDEDAIHKFVVENCSGDWEEFVETLFGYDVKMAVRRQRAASGEKATGRQFGSWRDPIIRWADQHLEQRQKTRERRHLQRLEQKRWEAEGVEESEARRRSTAAANTLVDQATALRELLATCKPGDREFARKQQEMFHKMIWAAQTGNLEPKKASLLAPLAGLLDLLTGPRTRILLGVFLLALCALWLQRNGMLPTSFASVKEKYETGELTDTEAMVQDWMPAFGVLASDSVEQTPTKPLIIPGFPEQFSSRLTCVNLGMAALILLLGSMMYGRWTGVFLFPAVLVTLFGNALGVPILMSIRGFDMTAPLIGFGVLLLGAIITGRGES